MTTKFKHKGKWKLLESDDWFDGTLSFDPESGARLEIFGTFNSFFDQTSKSIVLGKTIKGDITLIDVWYRKTQSATNGVTVGIYEPIMIIEGHHFKSESDICFRQAIIQVFNSFQWFDKSGLEKDIDYTDRNYKISYNKLAPIPFNINDTFSGKVLFDSPLNFENFNNEINLKEQSYFSFDYSTKTNFKDILQNIRYLWGFITLFTYEQSYPISITFRDESYTDKNINQPTPKYIKCIYQNSFYDSKYKLRRTHEHLVKYKDIQDSFPEILRKWFEMFNEHESVFSLMLYGFRKKNIFSTEKFMDTIRALETFHRHTHNNQRIPEGDYNNLINKILQSVELNKENTEWLANKLKGNEPSLNKRLKELIRENQNNFIKTNISSLKKYCREVTDTRNYYTHYDRSSEDKALKGKDLYYATLNAQGLLYSCIFKEIGLKDEHFEKGLIRLLYK